jgi:hypothetical protein
MPLTLEEMRLINAARKARLTPEQRLHAEVRAFELHAQYAGPEVTPVTVALTSVKKSATVKKSDRVRWEFRPSYTLPIMFAGPVPGVWCKVSSPRVNRGLEKRRRNQAKHQTARWRAGSSILYSA